MPSFTRMRSGTGPHGHTLSKPRFDSFHNSLNDFFSVDDELYLCKIPQNSKAVTALQHGSTLSLGPLPPLQAEANATMPQPVAYPKLPELPELPELPKLPELPELPDLLDLPELPELPDLLDLPVKRPESTPLSPADSSVLLLPLKSPLRRSRISSPGLELDNRLQSPRSGTDSEPQSLGGLGYERRVAVILDKNLVPRRIESGVPAHVDVRTVPEALPDELLLPQPKNAIPKILHLTTKLSSPTIALTPTGHNPTQKIRQLTGLSLPADQHHSAVTVPLRPVSQLSSSSISSDDGDNVSDQENDTSSEVSGVMPASSRSTADFEKSPRFPSWDIYRHPHRLSTLPKAFNEPESFRRSNPLPTRLVDEDVDLRRHSLRTPTPPPQSPSTQEQRYDLDEYHATAAQIAREMHPRVVAIAPNRATHKRSQSPAPEHRPVNPSPLYKSDEAPGTRPPARPPMDPTLNLMPVTALGSSRPRVAGSLETRPRPQSLFERVTRLFDRYSSSKNLHSRSASRKVRSPYVDFLHQAQKTSALQSRKERERETLKKQIRVVGQGGRVEWPVNSLESMISREAQRG
jgi:hypothetical protein